MAKVRERYNAGSPKHAGELRPEFLKIQRALKLVTASLGEVAAAATVPVTDLTTLTLTGNAALTLDTEGVMSGDTGFLEVTQDAIGGRVPTWPGALAAVAPAAAAAARTMYFCVFNGTAWVLSVHASNY